MRYMLLSLLAFFPVAAPAENSGCNIHLHVSDEDPSGTNIRNAPNGEVVLTLPLAKETSHEVHAIEYRDGWWRIDTISHEHGTTIALDEGWVHKSVIGTGLDDGEVVDDGQGGVRLVTPIYSQPTYRSKSGKFMMHGGKTEILGCSTMWLKIRHTYQGESLVGWWAPEDQCESVVTNCSNGSSGEDTGTDSWGNN